MGKYTKEQWKHASQDMTDSYFYVLSAEHAKNPICTVHPQPDLEVAAANARLIAAAPELLEALEYMLEVRRMENDPNETDIFEPNELEKYQAHSKLKAQVAINKARGTNAHK